MSVSELQENQSKLSKVSEEATIIRFFSKPTFKKMLVFSFSIFGAGILWFLSALNHNYTSYIKYPIKFVYDPNRYIPTQKLPTYISLNATGYGWDFLQKSLSIKRKPVLLKPTDLENKKFYTQTELLNAFSHQLPKIKVNFFETDTLFIGFDLLQFKKVHLVADTIACNMSFFPKDKNLHFILQPSFIQVSGSRSEILELPDTLTIKLINKDLGIGYNETFDIKLPSNRNTLKTETTEVEIKLEASNSL
jgi:hypothetical protein